MNDLNCRRNSTLMDLLFLFFVVFSPLSSTTASNVTIFRNSTVVADSATYFSSDKFNISSNQCTRNVDVCRAYGGTKLQDNCQCTCSDENSTFGLYNKEWKCTQNSIVRRHAGKPLNHQPNFCSVFQNLFCIVLLKKMKTTNNCLFL